MKIKFKIIPAFYKNQAKTYYELYIKYCLWWEWDSKYETRKAAEDCLKKLVNETKNANKIVTYYYEDGTPVKHYNQDGTPIK